MTALIITARQSRPYAPAFMRAPPPAVPGIAAANSKPPSPAARPVEADGVRRPAAGDQRLPFDPCLGESPGELQHERVDTVVVDEQVRAEPDRLDRDPLRGSPAQGFLELADRCGSGEEPGRPTCADRREARERDALEELRRSHRQIHRRRRPHSRRAYRSRARSGSSLEPTCRLDRWRSRVAVRRPAAPPVVMPATEASPRQQPSAHDLTLLSHLCDCFEAGVC